MTHRANDLTKQTVKNMARYLPKTHIAKYMGIDIKTLNKYYEDELRDSVKLKLQLVETAFDIAINDRNVTMLIFLLKTWVGMTEEQAKKEKQEFVEYNRIYSQAAGMTGEPRRAFLTQQFNEHLPYIRPSEIEDDDWEYENNGILE